MEIDLIQTNPRVAQRMNELLAPFNARVNIYVPHDYLERHFSDAVVFLHKKPPDLLIYEIPTPYRANFEQYLRLRKKLGTPNLPVLLTAVDLNLVKNVEGWMDHPVLMEVKGVPFNEREFTRKVARLLVPSQANPKAAR